MLALCMSFIIQQISQTLSSMLCVRIMRACTSSRFHVIALSTLFKISMPSRISKKSSPQKLDCN